MGGCEVAGCADFLRRHGVGLSLRRPVLPRRPALRTPLGLLGVPELQVALLVLHPMREVLLAANTGDRLVGYVQLAPSADQRPSSFTTRYSTPYRRKLRTRASIAQHRTRWVYQRDLRGRSSFRSLFESVPRGFTRCSASFRSCCKRWMGPAR